jgi:AraC-like DNA-binding protein
MHARPAEAWTVDELANRVGLSRSALAERFTNLLGAPPMQYLTRWRLQLATELLRSGRQSIAAIADEVGYESESGVQPGVQAGAGYAACDLAPDAWT